MSTPRPGGTELRARAGFAAGAGVDAGTRKEPGTEEGAGAWAGDQPGVGMEPGVSEGPGAGEELGAGSGVANPAGRMSVDRTSGHGRVAADYAAGREGHAPASPREVSGVPIPVTVLVVAKAPVPGFAKTRLCPPLTPVQAARLAAAALLDTLDAVRACPAAHRMVAFTGELAVADCAEEIRGALADFEVMPQRGTGFGVRLANAHADAARAGLPVLQIGMDTPQVSPGLLTDAACSLAEGAEALLGPAGDGGWWALGLSDPRAARLLIDVPMSTDRTGAVTRKTLQALGYRVAALPLLDDVDHYVDALRVAADCHGRFAVEVRALSGGRVVR